MITLPLLPAVNRCLAHGKMQGDTCEKADQCARHVSIRHDATPVPAYYSACSDDKFIAYIPIAGFPPKDEE